MKLIDKLADSISARIIVTNNNDEQIDRLNAQVYSLKHENERLVDSRALLNKRLRDKEKCVRELENELKRVTQNYNELSKAKTNTELKNRLNELKKEITKYKNLNDNNRSYRELYEYISDDSQSDSIKEVFSHNLNQFVQENGMSDAEAARAFKMKRETLRNVRLGQRKLTVTTAQKFDELLCEYYDCSVLDLVKVKMEGK